MFVTLPGKYIYFRHRYLVWLAVYAFILEVLRVSGRYEQITPSNSDHDAMDSYLIDDK